ncbi:MAG: hypothetical protein GX878_10465 [Firmicutes bacterium]|nr:hypothetical protein [Bacillota bacterium]
MAQYKTIIDKEDLHQLFNQDQGMAKLVEKVLNKVLEAEVAEELQAEPYERSEDRQGYRNSYRDRETPARKVIRIFPNTDSAIRLLGALLMEQDEICSTGRLYFNMEHYREWKEADKVASKDGEKENKGKAA